MEADGLRQQLEYVSDGEMYWEQQKAVIEGFYLALPERLAVQRHQLLCRWLCFCTTSAAKDAMRPKFEWHLAKLGADLTLSAERAQRIKRLPAGDEKRLCSADMIDYHRRAAYQGRMGTRAKRLLKTLDWSAQRAGCEMMLSAKEQLRETASDQFAREGNVRDGVPLMSDSKSDMDGRLRVLIASFALDDSSDDAAGAESTDASERAPSPTGTTKRKVDLLDESREGDLLSLSKGLFTRMHREQSPGLIFPPYSSSAVHGGGGAPPESTPQEPVRPHTPEEPVRPHTQIATVCRQLAIHLSTHMFLLKCTQTCL